jgi:ADP-ribosylglycohydrolase
MTFEQLPPDYAERVYAGWLGKCIGVRFGAPLENWTYEEIRDNLGELTGYVTEDRGKIFKPDDDTAVPMILIRALEDNNADIHLSADQIGDAILNYVGYEHGSFWWGGYGISTEHTAYLNLVNGVSAPLSGSIRLNGVTMAEQIGGQIFSDIWGLVAPGQPALAADLAERAASVTHDGNGIYGARFLAAMISAAFSESNPTRLIDIGLVHIPAESEYARVICAMADFYRANPHDWRAAFAHLKAHFGYDRYGGVVHIIPNAGVIALGLLYGEGDFSRTLQITNMAGWDTDCNVGNVGAIMGVARGLDAISPIWREPINDLQISASLIGTRNILTIPQCADLFVRLAHLMRGLPAETKPRYHFQYRGSTNSFQAVGHGGYPFHLLQVDVDGQRALRTAIRKLNKKGEVRIFTRTNYRPRELSSNYYGAAFTPLLWPGQTISALVQVPAGAPQSVYAALYVYDENHSQTHQAEGQMLMPGAWHRLTFTIPSLTDAEISQVGVLLRNTGEVWETGAFHLAELDWAGTPDAKITFAHARHEVGAISGWTYWRGYWRLEDGAFHGSGAQEAEAYTGDILWTDYTVSAVLTPLLGDHHLLLARVQGALRSYAVGLAPEGKVAIYKKNRTWQPMITAPFAWQHGRTYTLALHSYDHFLSAEISSTEGEEKQTLSWHDEGVAYLHGQVGLGTGAACHMRCTALHIFRR